MALNKRLLYFIAFAIFWHLNTNAQTPASIAGSTTSSSGYVDATGSNARFSGLSDIIVGSNGDIYVTEATNCRIRKITQSGEVTTFSGIGFGGTDGAANVARFASPTNLTFDGLGNVIVSDANRVRRISSNGTVVSVAGQNTSGSFSDGTGTAARFSNINGIVVNSNGDYIVTDRDNHCIRRVTPSGVVTTLYGTNVSGFVNATGTSARFNTPNDIVMDASGNYYVSESGNDVIRKITPAGVVTTLAGSGTAGSANGTGTAASFNNPSSLAWAPSGDLLVLDNGNSKIRRVTMAGVVTDVFSNSLYGTSTNGIANSDFGFFFTNSNQVYRLIDCNTLNGSTPSITGPNSICSGSSGTITTTRTISGSESYLWSNGATTNSISVTSAGTYSLSIVQSSTNCTTAASNTITVSVNSLPSTATISGSSTFCSGSSVNITTTRTLGTNEAYLWSNGATTQNISVNTSGTYSLRIRNTSTGCTSAISNEVILTESPIPSTPTITGPTTLCTSGSILLSTTYSLGANEAYLWSDNSSNNTLRVTSTGTYSLRIRNTVTGCTSLVSNQITVASSGITAPSAATINGSSSGNTTACGSTTLTGRTLQAGESYLWSDGSTASTLTVTSSGTYTLVIINNTCTSTVATRTVTINSLPTSPTISGPTTFCSGGSIVLTNSYTLGANEAYLWSNGASTSSINVTSAGTYTLRIRNTSTACTSNISNSIVVTSGGGTAPTAATINTPPTTCTGSVMTLTTNRVLGTNQSFLWSDGSTGSTLDVTTAGTYTLRVVNTATSCTSSVSSRTVSFATLPSVANVSGSSTQSICNGASLTLTTSRTLGTNEAYLWSNGETTQSINVSSVGTYSVRIRNTSTGCTSNVGTSVTVVETAAPTTPSINGPTELCSGGTIVLTTTYTLGSNEAYLWSDNSSSSTLTVSAAGTYSLRVRNTSTGCTSSISNSIVVTSSSAAIPTISGNTSFCSGGSVSITTSYSLGSNEAFLWSNNSTGSSITVSTAGSYSLRIRNSLTGCTTANSNVITVTVNSLPSTPTISGSSTFCESESTTLTTTRTLGTNEAYLWSDNSSGNTLTVTTGGTYSLRIRNSSTGCTSAVSNTITVTTNPAPTTPVITGPSSFCPGSSITLTASTSLGANQAYLWSTGATTSSITVNAAGNYSLIIRNTATSCTSAVSNTISVVSNTTPVTPTISGPSSFCSGTSITLNAGTSLGPNEAYLWNDGTTSNSITVSSASTYTLRIRNSVTGCTSSAVTKTISAATTPDPVGTIQTLSGGVTCFGFIDTLVADGVFDVGMSRYVSGDDLLANEFYLWQDGTVGDKYVASQTATYSVRVVNSVTGCSSSVRSIDFIVRDSLATPSILGSTQLCSGGTVVLSSSFTPTSNDQLIWNGPGINSSNESSQTLIIGTPGNYTLRFVRTLGGRACTSAVSNEIILIESPNPSTPTISGPTSFCSGSSIDLTTSYMLGTNEEYLWSSGATTSSINVTSAGTYTLRIRNTSTGCTSAISNEIILTESPIPSTPTISGPTSFCSGSSIDLTTSYTLGTNEEYLWSTGATTSSINVNSAGTYTLRIRNTSTGCTSNFSNSIVVTSGGGSAVAEATINTPPATCAGSIMTLTTNRVLGTNESFLWSDGSTGSTLEVTTAGTYTLRVVNIATNCTSIVSSRTVSFTAVPVPAYISGSGARTICSGSFITLTTTRTLAANQAYLWSNGETTQSINVTSAGTYTVRVRNTSTGCTSILTPGVTVTINPLPSTPTIIGPTLICPSSTVTLSGPSGMAGYIWSNGATTETAVINTAGTYTLQTINVAGCTSEVSIGHVVNDVPAGGWLGYNTNWNDPNNWCGGVPTSITDVTLPSATSNFPQISGTTEQCRNLNIPSGSNLDINSNAKLNLYGSLTGDGNVKGRVTSQLNVCGTSLQTIKNINVGTLTINNTAGVNLNSDITIRTSLDLVNGVLNTGSNSVNLLPTAQTLTETASSYVLGKVRISSKMVGTGSINLMGVSIASGADDLDTVLIERRDEIPTFGSNQGIGYVWSIRSGNPPSSGRNVTFSWRNGITNNKNLSAMQVYRRPEGSSDWLRVGTVQNASSRSITVNTTNFSDWTVSDTDQPLPVTFGYFNGNRNGDRVILNWNTLTEINASHFEVEASADGKTFKKVGTVAAAGNSNSEKKYKFSEINTINQYYRLKQIDMDGLYTYSKTINIATTSDISFTVYPNPTTGKVSIFANKQIEIQVFNSLGRRVLTLPLQSEMELDLSCFGNGLFTLRSVSDTSVFVQKVLVK